MKVPYHTEKCREGYGCAPGCPVLILAEDYDTAKIVIEMLEKQIRATDEVPIVITASKGKDYDEAKLIAIVKEAVRGAIYE